MKRKLAFLLAAVMILSLLPVNTAFARTIESLSRDNATVYGSTLLIEPDSVQGGKVNSEVADGPSGDVDYVLDGNDLVLTVDGSVREGDQVRIELENAEFMFRADSTFTGYNPPAQNSDSPLENIINPRTQRLLAQEWAGTYNLSLGSHQGVGGPSFFTINQQKIFKGGELSSYDPTKGIWWLIGSANDSYVGRYIRYAGLFGATGSVPYVSNYTGTAFQAGKLQVPYMLSVDAGNNSAATLTILSGKFTNSWDRYVASEHTMYYYGVSMNATPEEEVPGVGAKIASAESILNNIDGTYTTSNNDMEKLYDDSGLAKNLKNKSNKGSSAKELFNTVFNPKNTSPTTLASGDIGDSTSSGVKANFGLFGIIEALITANGGTEKGFWSKGYPRGYDPVKSPTNNGLPFTLADVDALSSSSIGVRTSFSKASSLTDPAATFWGIDNITLNSNADIFLHSGGFGSALLEANNMLKDNWETIRQNTTLLVGGNFGSSGELLTDRVTNAREWLDADWLKPDSSGKYQYGRSYNYLTSNIGRLESLVNDMTPWMNIISDAVAANGNDLDDWDAYINGSLGNNLSDLQILQAVEWARNMYLVYDSLDKMVDDLYDMLTAIDIAKLYANGIDDTTIPEVSVPTWWHNSYKLYWEGNNTWNDFEAKPGTLDWYDYNYTDPGDPYYGFIQTYRGGRWEIRIPLVTRVKDEGYAFVVIPESSVGGNISATRLAYANAAGGGTKTVVNEPETARTEFPVDIRIRENRFGSLKTGAFRVTAPAGFEWNAFTPYPAGNTTSTKPEGDNVGIRINDALGWRSGNQWYGVPGTVYTVEGNNEYYTGTGQADTRYDYYIGFPPTGGAAPSYSGSYMSGTYNWANGGAALNSGTQTTTSGNNYWAVDRSTLIVILSGLIRSGQNSSYTTPTVGELVIENLKLIASDTAPWGDIWLEVENLSANESGVSKDYKVLAGTRVDWTISLTTISDITTLYSGRYSTNLAVINRDKDHETAKVRFKENSVNAWWAGRVTNFNLNEQAKFRKVKFEDIDELASGGGSYLENAEGVDVAKMFYNDGRKYSKLTFSGNIMTLQNFQVNANKRAKFDFTPYVSIQPGYEGPITLGVDGSAIPTENPPPAITIANALSIVKVTTIQKDLLIGYQWQKTENITLNETTNGLLRKDEVVRLSITDHVTNDITFGPDMQYTVNPRGIKISNWSTTATGMDLTSNSAGTGGTIQFSIGATSAEATEIEISNISVKIDRTVPVSNQRPYDVVVWGNAVAANYAFENERNKAAFDTFTTFGPNLLAPYVRIVSSANDASTILTQEVRVPIGQNYYIVNGQTHDMPDAQAYINVENDSTYVPLRFVTQAFGLQPDQIVYDKGVITIIHPTRIIQFTVDVPVMIINGTSIPILNTNGKPVSPETKPSLTPGFVRTYVPFRALGDAFGIPVSWDSDNQIAIYNEGADTFFEAPNLTNRSE